RGVGVPDEATAHLPRHRDHDQLLELLRQALLVPQGGPKGFQTLSHLGHVQEERVRPDVGPARSGLHEGVVRVLFRVGDLLSCNERYARHETSSGWRMSPRM